MMSVHLAPATQTILHTLLDRVEQRGRQRVVRVRLSKAQHSAYFSPEESEPRIETNRALQALAAAGVLRLHWRKWEEGNWLDAVDLVLERADELYTLLARQPRSAQTNELLALLNAEQPHAGWHGTFLAWAQHQLETGRSPAPLLLGDSAHNRDLLRLVAALAQQREPVLERTLSSRLFGDSKRLESLRGACLSILRRHDPEAAAFTGDDGALLRAHGIERVPEYVPLAGPLRLAQPGTDEHQPACELELRHFHPAVALSAATLRSSGVAACAAHAIVTVENMTSFNELLAVRPPELLVLYTGGFASPAVIGLLRAIRAQHPTLPYWHWGDLDVGGLRILRHLRSQLGAVGCLAMDAATLRAHQPQSKPLNTSEREALIMLRADALLSDCDELIGAMLELGCKLEQEAVGGAMAHQEIL
ncbi:Wadjet anti-phage system protein JetD domain-containing protein [Candidatus Viridilinea mediisalina]|uniref:Wadjet protein JetD C-terminal domain-containing protein n=1 Tax=Candidatus Viridilinea mediisalina TaxID=2024553 RepID=A0A2A6RJY5_9CHLR|nr:Wadjet anti-phage system protein JetD domain-containing protein [Candidatus Viridilinea mediisalina]PDW03332.1 hypothetical protein CJ255_09465 [Candidatus Viridilinea mediisalina]